MSGLFRFGCLIGLCLVWLLGPGCGGVEESCKDNGDCPTGAKCQLVQRAGLSPIRLCIRDVKLQLGSVCDADSDCLSGVCWAKSGAAFRVCTTQCSGTNPCRQGFTCEEVRAGLKLCLIPTGGTTPKGCSCGKSGDSCASNGHGDCDTLNGYFCLSSGPNDTKAICTRQCDPNAAAGSKDACAEGQACLESASGLFLCGKPQYTQGPLGTNCGKGGKAECKSDLFCFSRWPNDGDAFCSKYCNPYNENDCGDGFVCESPRQQDPWLCIPKGQKSTGGDCTQRSFLDCQSGICAKNDLRDEKSFCTETCEPDKDSCPAGWECRLFGYLYRYMCAKAGGGDIGSLCTKNGAAQCKSGICIELDGAINKICTDKCSPQQPCPGGFECDQTKLYCVPKTGKKKIGEACTSPQDCIYGTCASDSQGKLFCTQQCTEDNQCPDGFVCRNLEFTQRYCLPKLSGEKKLGESCPNGPGDCETGNCLSDPINGTTFCTQPCDDQNRICPKPYKCTRLNEREAYCTPVGYQPP